MKKRKKKRRGKPRRRIKALSDDVGLKLLEKLVSIIGMSGELNGLKKVEGEDTQNGLAIHNMTTDAQVDIIGVTAGDVYKLLHVLSQAELYVNGSHYVVSLTDSRTRRI